MWFLLHKNIAYTTIFISEWFRSVSSQDEKIRKKSPKCKYAVCLVDAPLFISHFPCTRIYSLAKNSVEYNYPTESIVCGMHQGRKTYNLNIRYTQTIAHAHTERRPLTSTFCSHVERIDFLCCVLFSMFSEEKYANAGAYRFHHCNCLAAL